MSYFAFGLIDLKPESTHEAARAAVALSTERHATAAGMAIALGGEREPSILSAMRGAFSAQLALPFLCRAHVGDDVSDGLLSPHVLGLDGAGEGLVKVADWVARTIRITGVLGVRIWLTEGFDVAFRCRDCRIEELAPFLLERLREENDIPSLLLRIVPD